MSKISKAVFAFVLSFALLISVSGGGYLLGYASSAFADSQDAIESVEDIQSDVDELDEASKIEDIDETSDGDEMDGESVLDETDAQAETDDADRQEISELGEDADAGISTMSLPDADYVVFNWRVVKYEGPASSRYGTSLSITTGELGEVPSTGSLLGEGTVTATPYETNGDLPWRAYFDEIRQVVFNMGEPADGKWAMDHWFDGMENLSLVNLANVSGENLVSATSAFANCPLLKEIDIDNAFYAAPEGVFDDAFVNIPSLRDIWVLSEDWVNSAKMAPFAGCDKYTGYVKYPMYFSESQYPPYFDKNTPIGDGYNHWYVHNAPNYPLIKIYTKVAPELSRVNTAHIKISFPLEAWREFDDWDALSDWKEMCDNGVDTSDEKMKPISELGNTPGWKVGPVWDIVPELPDIDVTFDMSDLNAWEKQSDGSWLYTVYAPHIYNSYPYYGAYIYGIHKFATKVSVTFDGDDDGSVRSIDNRLGGLYFATPGNKKESPAALSGSDLYIEYSVAPEDPVEVIEEEIVVEKIETPAPKMGDDFDANAMASMLGMLIMGVAVFAHLRRRQS